MSKDIKFRAWHEVNLQFSYKTLRDIWKNGVNCVNAGNTYATKEWRGRGILDSEITDITFTPNADWEQYTGLKDKNSVEAYQGDMVRIKVGQIFYDRKIFQAVSGAWCVSVPAQLSTNGEVDIMLFSIDFEIVGNVHEESK